MVLISRSASLVLLAFSLISLAQATTEETLYGFGTPRGGRGMFLYFSPVFDNAGNMYGTTLIGGSNDVGVVFELSPGTDGGWWTETIIHEFTGRDDGAAPAAGLTFDKEGNLYGTANSGGVNGTGVVFELSPSGSEWTYKVLYSFGASNSGDGSGPDSSPVFDKEGNIYGITGHGGGPGCYGGCGTVYELLPAGDGTWTEKLVHSFPASRGDGEVPSGGLLIDREGSLYGTTAAGGTAGSGVLFKLSYSAPRGEWIETIVHQFVGGKNDGSGPFDVVPIMDGTGNIYGTTYGGGAYGHGTVFEGSLTPKGWKTKVLYSFNEQYDGQAPDAGLTMDTQGNLYGTTTLGGATTRYGTVFKLSKSSSGSWAETILHSFDGRDGYNPIATLTFRDGWFYGTTLDGGNNGGAVFRVRP
jgi:uncharacterized repeat protein (TIGR03803 family)